MTASPRNRPRGVSVSVSSPAGPGAAIARPPVHHPLERSPVDDRLEPGERQRLVEAQAEHHALLRLRARIELLELPRRVRRPIRSAPR